MNEQELLTLKTITVIACLVLLFVAERLMPAAVSFKKADSGVTRIGRNLSFWGINGVLSPLVVLPVTVFGVAQSWGWRPDWLVGGVGLLLDVIVLDFWLYWWHRVNHSLPVLWRFHRVHHMDEWLDTTSAVRFHFGEVVLSALARLPIILLMGMPLLSVIVFEALVLIAAGFQHSNLKLPHAFERKLSHLVITPSIHWVHHHVLRADTNSNYGTLFSFWDRWFGSRSANPRRLDMCIGLDDTTDQSLFRLLLAPFKRQ